MTDMPRIQCAHCSAMFEGFAETQADGCAADIIDNTIIGHYGSAEADLECLTIDPKRREEVPASGIICDECIAALDAKGIFTERQVRDAFGA